MQARAAKDLKTRKNSAAHWGGTVFFVLCFQRGIVQGVAGQAGVVRYPTHGLFQLHTAVPQGQHPCCALFQRQGRQVLLLPARYHQNVLPPWLVVPVEGRGLGQCGADRVFMELCQLTAQGDRPVALCRELTKLHEDTVRTTLAQAAAFYRDNEPRGEYVLVVAGREKQNLPALTLEEGAARVLALRDGGMKLKEAVRRVADDTGLPRNALYDTALKA